MTHPSAPKRTQTEKFSLIQFGKNLKKAREAKRLSQEELAHLAGFSRSYYTEIETGKRNPSFLNIIKLIKTLGVDANELFAGVSKT